MLVDLISVQVFYDVKTIRDNGRARWCNIFGILLSKYSDFWTLACQSRKSPCLSINWMVFLPQHFLIHLTGMPCQMENSVAYYHKWVVVFQSLHFFFKNCLATLDHCYEIRCYCWRLLAIFFCQVYCSISKEWRDLISYFCNFFPNLYIMFYIS